MNFIKRIGNFALQKSVYLVNEPEHPSYEIVRINKNPFYQTEDQYLKDDDDYYYKKETPNFKIHKSVFKNPETIYTIASIPYNSNNGDHYYRTYMHIDDLPSTKEYEDVLSLLKYAYSFLNVQESISEQ